MRVCFIAHSSALGGAERVLLETIETLQGQGVECRVLLPSHGEFCAELGRLNIPFSIVPYPPWMRSGKAHFYGRLKRALRIAIKTPIIVWKVFRWKCDLVYTNTVTVCIGAIAARLLGRPHIWHLHEFGAEDHNLSFVFGERLSMKAINWMSSRCICVSHALAKKYERTVDQPKITVIYPSMHHALREWGDMGRMDSVSLRRSERFRCVIVGNLIEGKGQEDAVLAFSHLKNLGVNAELIIVGDGDLAYRRRLEELVQSNGLEGRVMFAGKLGSAIQTIRSSDAVLVCSRSEGFGRITIEGMLAGKPVIGSRAGATQELISDQVNGILYTCGDPADLAKKISWLYSNPSEAIRLGQNGKMWAENMFTKDRHGREILAVFSSLNLDAVRPASVPR
jgi:glycosyltransferase involved in cell wall biosynthesis